MVRLSLIVAAAAGAVVAQDPTAAAPADVPDGPTAADAPFSVPSTERAFWAETFQNTTTTKLFEGTTWVKSAGKKYREQKISVKKGSKLLGKYAADKALVMENKAQHYGFAAKLPEPFFLDGSKGKKSLVVQYEVKYPEIVKCAGTYLKLLRDSPSLNVSDLSDKSPFTIMFGPDKCDKNNKVHFIFNHQNPRTKAYEEKQLQISPEVKNDKLSHLYTLAIHDDNTFEMYADLTIIKNGSLYTLFKPSVLPPKEIDDPTDLKPTTWEETEFIPDPAAVKPADWDEDAPRTIPNLSIKKPDDWNDEVRGPWRQPMMTNPEYRGKWVAPTIENPDYVGEWEPRKIPNPDYFDDPHPARMDPIGAVALEVWSMSENIQLDNLWLGHNLNDAKKFARQTWLPKHEAEKKAIFMEPEPKKPTPPEHKKKEPTVFERIDEAVAWVQKYPLVAGLGAFFVFLVLLGFRGNPHHHPGAYPMSPVIQEVLDLDKNKDTSQVPRVPVDGAELRQRPATATTTTREA